MGKPPTIIAILVLAGFVFSAAGADQPVAAEHPTGPTTRPTTQKADARRKAIAQRHSALLARLKLPAEKHAQVSKILASHRTDVADWDRRYGGELTALRPKLRMFHTPQDPEKLAGVRKALARYQQLRADRAKLDTRLLDRLKKVLTDKQFAQAKKILTARPQSASGPMNKFHHLAKLGLTPEQVAKIKAIMDEAGKTQAGQQAAWGRIVKEVLTEDNRAALTDLIQMDAHRRMVLAMVRNIELTEVQSAKVDAIWKQAYGQATTMPEQKFVIYQKAQREVVQNVLTQEQRDQLSNQPSMQVPMVGGHGGMNRGAGGRPAGQP